MSNRDKSLRTMKFPGIAGLAWPLQAAFSAAVCRLRKAGFLLLVCKQAAQPFAGPVVACCKPRTKHGKKRKSMIVLSPALTELAELVGRSVAQQKL